MFRCANCGGSGEEVVGAMMHSDPYDYTDYDEVWEDCTICNGRGKTLNVWSNPWRWKLIFCAIIDNIIRPPKEEDIPF